jgi:ABC-type polysaccharide/polyol phosphate transport system ATPase subunit|tara:strand:- start:330 stop:539 length:210 start_codon:yes stop_codon:yes gene_type:complete
MSWKKMSWKEQINKSPKVIEQRKKEFKMNLDTVNEFIEIEDFEKVKVKLYELLKDIESLEDLTIQFTRR